MNVIQQDVLNVLTNSLEIHLENANNVPKYAPNAVVQVIPIVLIVIRDIISHYLIDNVSNVMKAVKYALDLMIMNVVNVIQDTL